MPIVLIFFVHKKKISYLRREQGCILCTYFLNHPDRSANKKVCSRYFYHISLTLIFYFYFSSSVFCMSSNIQKRFGYLIIHIIEKKKEVNQ